MKSKGIFVITSVYHILLSILLIEERKLKNNILILVEITPDIDSLISNLKSTPWFNDVILMIGRQKQKRLLGKLTYTLNRKKIVDAIDKQNPKLKALDTNVDYDIYISSPDSAKNYFMYKYKKQNKYMIEDGLKTYVTPEPKTLKKLTSTLVNRPLVNGFDKRITKVFATNPEKLPQGLHHKGEALNWKTTLKTLDKDTLSTLSTAFLPDGNLNDSSLFPEDKTKDLIITQTLNEDGILGSEKEKIEIYAKFIEQSEADIIYIKPHPREKTDYTEVYKNSNIVVLPRLFPAELLNLHPNLHFTTVFTAFSTAIEHITNTDKKVSLGLSYFKTK